MSKKATNRGKGNRYQLIIERIFKDRYQEGDREVSFERTDFARHAKALRIKLPKNLGDILYSFRYRVALPEFIKGKAPTGKQWLIRGTGPGRYCFALASQPEIIPNPIMAETKVPDATPGIIERYALSDEQALLAKLRYNRLVDVFTGITCYSLQSHLRTNVKEIGQVETDEIYIGLDRRGVHFVLPVQAKGRNDRLSIVQIEQDFAMAQKKFPALICRPIAAQFMRNDLIALFDFVQDQKGVAVSSERHYRLVPPSELTEEELKAYQRASP